MATVNVTPATFTGGTTIQSLVTANAAGTIFQFAPGLYRRIGTVTTPKNTIQFIGDPGGGTVISGSDVIDGWSLSALGGSTTQGTWTSNFTFTRVTPQSSNQGGASLAQFGEEVFFDGVRLTPTLTNPPPVGSWFWSSGKIVISQNPVGHLVEIAQSINFFVGGNGLSGEVMQDLTIQHFACPSLASPYGAVVAGPSATYRRNTFRDNHSVGLVMFSASTTVVNNVFMGNGCEGYAGSGCNGYNFSNNVVIGNGVADFTLLNEGGAGKITQATGGTFQNNLIMQNAAQGAWWDVTNLTQTISNNLVVENYSPGIFYEISTTGTITWNACIRNGIAIGTSPNPYYSAGVILSNSSSSTISNNFIEAAPHGGAGIALSYDASRVGSGTTNNNTVSSNTIVFNDTTAATAMVQYNGTGGPAGYTETFSSNTYISPNTTDAHFGNWTTNTQQNFTTFKAAGFDTSGSVITAATWPATNVIYTPFTNASVWSSGELVNTKNGPCALFGGVAGQTFDPGAFPWPAHIWLNGGTNTLIVRAGQSGMVVHDWVTSGGVNNIVLVGYTFANVAAALAAFVASGSNVVLTLTDSTTVTFIGATTAAFTGKVSLSLAYSTALAAPVPAGISFQRSQGNGPPPAGTWGLGDRIYNTTPTVLGSAGSQYTIDHWTCVVAGTPGTWVPSISLTGT
jgi:hypothetical protein